VLVVEKLVWDRWNISHIARHDIVPEEIYEVCSNKPVIQRGAKRNRLVLLGNTNDDRLINVVLESRGKRNYYPITAYDASPEDEVLHERLKGGEDIQ
jgi:uncharacterized DUF497 family protein